MAQREDLESLRLELFAALAEADVAVKAQIVGQLRAVIKDLAALADPEVEVSAADEIGARRQARRVDAADSAPPTRRGQSGRRGGSHRSS